MENLDTKPLHIMLVEPRGSGGMMHYAYQLCTALANQNAVVTLVTSNQYEMDSFPHNFTVRKQMKLWSPTESGDFKFSGKKSNKTFGKVLRMARRITRGSRFIKEWIKLTNYILKVRPDIVQFGSIEFPFEAFFLHYLKKRGLVLTQICHEFESRERSKNIVIAVSNQLYRWVFKAFDIMFFHAENNRERFRKLFKHVQAKQYIIQHGNEQLFLAVRSKDITAEVLKKRYGIATNAPIVLFFGNLMPSKGLHYLIQAFAEVYRQQSSARLLIVGRPSKLLNLDDLLREIDQLEISQAAVIDASYLAMEEVAPLMDLSTVVVYPYINSTQSGALQVAYTFGKPVIATTAGGLPDAVDHGRSGLLVPPADAHQLAVAILELINNPPKLREMGEYAKHLSNTKFSWDTISHEVLTIYEAFLGSKAHNS